MKNTNIIDVGSSSKTTRMLVLSIMGVAIILMAGLTYTASAATLTRQLELGMSGSDVTALQTFLARDNTIYPQGLITGYFGSLTKSAVSNFQARNGISNIGRVGPVTLAALNLQMDGNISTGADIYAPMINSLNVNVSSNSATFYWNTNENSSAVIYYGTSYPNMTESGPGGGVSISGASYLVNADLLSSHNAVVNSLSSNTTYYYVVYVRDGSGNETVTWPNTFRTAN